METLSPPPLKKICISKELLTGDNSKQVVQAFRLPQLAGRSQSGNGMQIMKFKSVDGKDIGEFKVKMISKGGVTGKTLMVMKPSTVEKNSLAKPPDPRENEESLIKLQSQYTTKAQGLLEVKKDPVEKAKQTAIRRPLILKKNVKPISKVAVEPTTTAKKVQLIQIAKPIVTDVKSLAVPEKMNIALPEQGKVIKSYTRTLKKIGPNMQLLPHDSPDAKQIINAVTEPVSTRNGTIRYIQKSVISQNGKPVINQPEPPKDLHTPKDISQNLTIIEQALSSLRDDQLREKALRALAECTTGNTRNTAVPTPDIAPKIGLSGFGMGLNKSINEVKSISDSSVQTEVFSLMEPGQFIIASSECEKLERRKAKEREAKEEIVTAEVPSKNAFQRDLDIMLQNVGPENEQVEKVLEKNKISFPEKLARNLYNDYTSMRKYDSDGMLGIHQAVIANDVKGVKRLLLLIKLLNPFGIDVDIKTLDGNTSLELAVECQVDEQIIEELLKAGAKPSTNDPMQNSAISLASEKFLPYLPLLVEHTDKERLNDYDLNGYTCLHYCAQNGDSEGARSLLIQGADPNLQDRKSGKTAMFMAMENQQEDVAKLIFTFNADPSIPNFAGQTILPFIETLKSYAFKAALHKTLR